MYVSEEMIDSLVSLYGRPEPARFTFSVDASEYRRIRSSQKNGRKHDFTLYIVKDDRIVVIAKHLYPPGLYRAPSGGLKPGEDVHVGIMRETIEETGCEIELQRFLLRSEVFFTSDIDSIEWNTYVFRAKYLRGDFNFTDRKEIREVRLASWDEFETFSAIMGQSKVGGLHYRAALHEAVQKLPLCP